jgi:hypothetical protein
MWSECAYEGGVDAMLLVIIVLVVIVVLVGGGVLAYNGLVRGRNRAQEAWSEIDIELKRHHDLIPNLVETVKGFLTRTPRSSSASPRWNDCPMPERHDLFVS